MKFKLLLSFLILISFFLLTNNVYAKDRTVTCKESGCAIDDDSALFKYSNVYPTWSKTKEVEIKNKYPKSMKAFVDISNHNFKDSNFDDVFEIEITKSGKNIYGPTSLEKFESKGIVSLGTISSDASKTYEFKVKMIDVGNEYQGKSIKFDLDLKFEAKEVEKETVVSTSVINSVVQQVLGKFTQSETKKPIEKETKHENEKSEKEVFVSEASGEVLGENDCKSNSWWLLLYIAILILLVIHVIFPNRYLKIAALFVSAISAYFIFTNVCEIIFTIIALGLGLLFLFDLKKLIKE